MTFIDELTERDLKTLATVRGVNTPELRSDLTSRPWAIHDLLGDGTTAEAILECSTHPSQPVSPFLFFSVLVHLASADLRTRSTVEDWIGPGYRLPVFDVEPLQEFVESLPRLTFLARLLASFVAPAPLPLPADPLSVMEMAMWLNHAEPDDRAAILRRLGDLALFSAGVFPDRTASRPLMPVDAERLGRTVGMDSDDILALTDTAAVGPGLTAYESLGAAWYERCAEEGRRAVPVLLEVAARFKTARRVLNHLADRYLYEIDLGWAAAA